MEKYESRKVRAEIRNVLLNVWDPIGIGTDANAQDEYDTYVGAIFELLLGGASDSEIASELLRIMHDRMELRSATLEQMQPTVTALRLIRLE